MPVTDDTRSMCSCSSTSEAWESFCLPLFVSLLLISPSQRNHCLGYLRSPFQLEGSLKKSIDLRNLILHIDVVAAGELSSQ